MSQEQMHARHLVELGFLEQIVKELGMNAQLMGKSEQVPYHTLLVELEPDSQDRPRQLALNFYPATADLVEDTLLLQYFVPLPMPLDAAAVERLCQVLPDINNKLVVGHFGLTAGQRQLHYRYVQALPMDEVISEEAVSDVLVLVSYSPQLFQDLLEEVATGKLSQAAALAKIDTIYAET